MSNIVTIKFNKINQPNLVFEIYRIMPEEAAVISTFHSLTPKEKLKYKFVTLDQDEYLNKNIVTGEQITVYDMDKNTYNRHPEYRDNAGGLTYHSFLDNDSETGDYYGLSTVLQKFWETEIYDFYYVPYTQNNDTPKNAKVQYIFTVTKKIAVEQTYTSHTINVSGYRLDEPTESLQTLGLLENKQTLWKFDISDKKDFTIVSLCANAIDGVKQKGPWNAEGGNLIVIKDENGQTLGEYKQISRYYYGASVGVQPYNTTNAYMEYEGLNVKTYFTYEGTMNCYTIGYGSSWTYHDLYIGSPVSGKTWQEIFGTKCYAIIKNYQGSPVVKYGSETFDPNKTYQYKKAVSLGFDVDLPNDLKDFALYNDNYYAIMPTMNFDTDNVRVQLHAYCAKLGGELLTIKTWQEFAIANYLIQNFKQNKQFKTNNYALINDCLLAETSPLNTDLSQAEVAANYPQCAKIVYDASVKEEDKPKNLFISNGASSGYIGYGDYSINLPFIVKIPKSVWDSNHNSLYHELYNTTYLHKFGIDDKNIDQYAYNYYALPEKQKEKELGYLANDGSLQSLIERNTFQCLLTPNAFQEYTHTVTMSSNGNSCGAIVLVLSAVPKDNGWDTLSLVVKTNKNSQDIAKVPQNVQFAIVYNLYQNDCKVVLTDSSFSQTGNWSDFAQGITVKIVKTKTKLDIYRTDLLTLHDTNKNLKLIGTISFANITQSTYTNFANGHIGYGYINHKGATFSNIQIDSSDYIAASKDCALEFVIGSNEKAVAVQKNIKDTIYLTVAQSKLDTPLLDEQNQRKNMAAGNPGAIIPDNVTANNQLVYNDEQTNISKVIPTYYEIIESTPYNYCYKTLGNYMFITDVVANSRAGDWIVCTKQPSIYNEYILKNWTPLIHDGPNKTNICHKQEDGSYVLYLPNFFNKSIWDIYKTFKIDSTFCTLYATRDSLTSLYSHIPGKTFIDTQKHNVVYNSVDGVVLEFTFTHYGYIMLLHVSDNNDVLQHLGVPTKAECIANNYAYNQEVILVNRNTSSESEKTYVYYYDDTVNFESIKFIYEDSQARPGQGTTSYMNMTFLHAYRLKLPYSSPNKTAVYNQETGTFDGLSTSWNPEMHTYDEPISRSLSYAVYFSQKQRNIGNAFKPMERFKEYKRYDTYAEIDFFARLGITYEFRLGSQSV